MSRETSSLNVTSHYSKKWNENKAEMEDRGNNDTNLTNLMYNKYLYVSSDAKTEQH